MRNYAIITTDSGADEARDGQWQLAQQQQWTIIIIFCFENYMKVSPASSLFVFVSVSVCVSVSVTGSTYYLWTSALCAPFSILQSLFAIRHSVIQCGPICCDCRCTSTSRICGTVSGPEIPFPFPRTAEQCQPTHTRTGRAKESVSRRIIVVWYLSLKGINSMDPSPMWCNYSYLVA